MTILPVGIWWPGRPAEGNQTKKTLPGTNSSPLPLDPWEDDFPFPYQVGCDGSQEGVPDFAFTMTYFLGDFWESSQIVGKKIPMSYSSTTSKPFYPANNTLVN